MEIPARNKVPSLPVPSSPMFPMNQTLHSAPVIHHSNIILTQLDTDPSLEVVRRRRRRRSQDRLPGHCGIGIA
jgi:hypothetical protein